MKKIILSILTVVFVACNTAFAIPPNFNQVKNWLTTDPNGKQETVYNPNTFQVSANSTLKENVYNLFSPWNNNSVIWNFIRILTIGVLVLYFAWTGIDFLLNPNDEGKSKAARRSFMYLLMGAFLVYWVTWILWKWLAIENLTWDSPNASGNFVNNLIGRVIFQVLSFLKAFAFFWAIVMIIWYGIQMVRALDKEDAIKTARKGIMNVLLALVFIKVIDFVFFIAQDITFVSRAKQFIFNISKGIWYALGIIMVLTLIYAGFRYISAGWDDAKVKAARSSLTNIFYVILILFLFLLVARQVIAEFA